MVILIHGVKRSGKDTFSDMLLREVGGTKKDSFALPMKRIIAKTFNMSMDELDYLKNNDNLKLCYTDSNTNEVTQLNITFRNILQYFGTEAMKPEFGDELWVKLLVKNYLNCDEPILVVSDFRLEEEYKYIVEGGLDVITVKINRTEVENSGDSHKSENGLINFDFDFIVDNNSTLENLHNEVQRFIDYMQVNL